MGSILWYACLYTLFKGKSRVWNSKYFLINDQVCAGKGCPRPYQSIKTIRVLNDVITSAAINQLGPWTSISKDF